MSNWAPTRRALVLSLDVGLRVTSVKLNVTEYSVPAPSEKGGYSPPGRHKDAHAKLDDQVWGPPRAPAATVAWRGITHHSE